MFSRHFVEEHLMVVKWGLVVGWFGEVGFWSLMEKEEGDWKRDEEAMVETDRELLLLLLL